MRRRGRAVSPPSVRSGGVRRRKLSHSGAAPSMLSRRQHFQRPRALTKQRRRWKALTQQRQASSELVDRCPCTCGRCKQRSRFSVVELTTRKVHRHSTFCAVLSTQVATRKVRRKKKKGTPVFLKERRKRLLNKTEQVNSCRKRYFY